MKYLFSCYLLLVTYYLQADVPGNKPRPSYDVKFTGINQYDNHLFFVQENNVVSSIKDSSTIHVQGGYGAPICLEVWAINKNNLLHTDTLSFCSGDTKKSKVIIVNIYNRHLTYSIDATNGKKQNTIPFSTVNNNQNDNDQFGKNKNIMYLISGLSFIILLALVFFVWKKNKQPILQQSS